MDSTDHQLLQLLQQDANMSFSDLAQATHISESSARRRVSALSKSGVLGKKVWLVNRDLAQGVAAFVSVSFDKETAATYQQFKRRMQAMPEVSQCYAVAGGNDFLMLVHARTLPELEAWHERELMSDAAIKRSESQVVWSTVKYQTNLPFLA